MQLSPKRQRGKFLFFTLKSKKVYYRVKQNSLTDISSECMHYLSGNLQIKFSIPA